MRRRSGASVGSIYHHFGDKEDRAALFVAVLRDYQEGLLAALAAGDDAERTVGALVATTCAGWRRTATAPASC